MSRRMDATLKRSHRQKAQPYDDFDRFYQECWEPTYRTLAVTIRNADLAREAVDEAMVRALANWRQVRSGPNPSGWVYRVAFNWSVDQIRRKGREIQRQTSGAFVHWDPDMPRPDLIEKINNLTLDQRAVLVLRVVNDWSEQDVSEALGIAVGTVKSRLFRALEALRTEVEES